MSRGGWATRITVRLLLVVFAMMVLTLGASFVLNAYYERQLIDEIGDQYESLSKALQISVQQLTAEGDTDAGLLQEYVQRLSSRGVREISILSNEKEVVASSNPRAKIGEKVPPARHGRRQRPLVITGTLGEEEGADSLPKTVQDLEIPIVVDNQKRGYVRLHLVLDDLEAFIRTAYHRRLIATLLLFGAGFAGLVAMSYGLTRDLRRVSGALQQVGEGILPERIPGRRQDEVGELIGTINSMVDQLREQRSLEQRVRRAERMSAIGHLAGSVAHEIRNPLNLISLSVDHLGEAFRPADPARAGEYAAVVASVRQELGRLNQLIREFLDFGRPPRLSPRPCRLEEIVDEVIVLTAPHAAEESVTIEKAVPSDLPPLSADPNGVRTCLVNLVVNAIQAIRGGGRISVEAHAAAGEPGRGPIVSVLVRDTGPGIDESNLDHVFEPYFSTKEGGFGLGLAITQRIVEESGGTIRVESHLGTGTVFQIDWPAAEAAHPSEVQA